MPAAEPSIPSMPEADEVHVWTVPCEGDGSVADALLPALSAHERGRAARLVREQDRRAFVIGRARVRQILGGYVSQPAGSLDVVARVADKPVLAGAPAGFDFSFSRCAALHVCAVTVNRRVGVDVELVGTGRDAAAIAATYFAPAECAWLDGIPPGERPAAFTDLWVKKEAFAKALGTGLRLPLHLVEAPRDARGPMAAPPDTTRWMVEAFTPPGVRRAAAEWAGAVAAAGDWRLTLVPWPGPAVLPAR